MAWFRQQLGFDTYAAGVPVKILGQNLHVCTADPCTVTSPSGGGSLVVENSIKFGDGTTQTTAAVAAVGVPTGGVMFFNLASCPTGWTELTTARGMYIVGLPLSGTLAGTSGTALTNLESRPVGQHTHAATQTSHNHTSVLESGGGATGNSRPFLGDYDYWWLADLVVTSSSTSPAIDVSLSGTTTGTNAPYIQLLACQKS